MPQSQLMLVAFVISALVSRFAVVFGFLENLLAGATMLLVILINSGVTIIQLVTQQGIRIEIQEQRLGLAGKVGELVRNLGFVRVAWLAGTALSRRLWLSARNNDR